MDSLLKINLKNSRTIIIPSALSSVDRKISRKINLIFDTGADKTAISKSTLMQMGYTQFIPSNTEKRSAIGIFRPETTIVSELIIGGQFRLSHFLLDVLEAESSSTFDGIIGMDFISQLEVTISNKNKLLTVEKA